MEKIGVRPLISHAPSGEPAHPETGEGILRRTKRAIECAAVLGCPDMVYHVGCLPGMTRKQYMDFNVNYVRELLPLLEKHNITLVGMPGCGKSTIGKTLAAITGREFLDLDDVITKTAGMPIPEIFAKFGEPHFRNLETECLADISKNSGMVLAMGGGTPVRPENRRMIRQKSKLHVT